MFLNAAGFSGDLKLTFLKNEMHYHFSTITTFDFKYVKNQGFHRTNKNSKLTDADHKNFHKMRESKE